MMNIIAENSVASSDFNSDNVWEYHMRREMQEIIPGLYLGPYAAATKTKLNILLEHNITHIVCIRHAQEALFVKPNFPEHFKYLVLEIADSAVENIITHFPKVKQFLDSCFSCGGKVLVHGNTGISRSASLVIAYLMEKYGLTYRKALSHVQERRYCINPNEGFAQQLMGYEPIYRARLMTEYGESSKKQGLNKRKLEDDDWEPMDSAGCS